MNEKSKTPKEVLLKDFEKNFEKYFEKYEKSLLWKKFENYQRNLMCIQDVTDRLLGHMKGYEVSFKSEITDEKGRFSQEKLSDFVEELLSRWAAKQREGTFTDLSTGESMAESYIRMRQELYSSYLYLVMRCSLCKGDYALVTGSGMEERTDFAFLLEQAKRLFQSWCVMEDIDGNKKNELFWGYDNHFGLHLYRVLSCPAAGSDNGFDLIGRLPVDRPAFLTDEGNVKRNKLKSIYLGRRPGSLAKKAQEDIQPDEEDIVEDSCEDENSYDWEDSYDDDYDMADAFVEYDDWEYPEEYDDAWYEAGQIRAQKQADIEYLTLYFEHQSEYVEKCRCFVELFQQAEHDVLRGFCEDMDEIVALYLAERDIPPVMDTDKALDVYSGIYDGPCRQAERYARGIQWKNL